MQAVSVTAALLSTVTLVLGRNSSGPSPWQLLHPGWGVRGRSRLGIVGFMGVMPVISPRLGSNCGVRRGSLDEKRRQQLLRNQWHMVHIHKHNCCSVTTNLYWGATSKNMQSVSCSISHFVRLHEHEEMFLSTVVTHEQLINNWVCQPLMN